MAAGDATRAEKLQDEYRLRIDRALRFCMRLGEQDIDRLRSIEVGAYDRPAIWKMVIFGNYLWPSTMSPASPRVTCRPTSSAVSGKINDATAGAGVSSF